jgi:hypothetical protein
MAFFRMQLRYGGRRDGFPVLFKAKRSGPQSRIHLHAKEIFLDSDNIYLHTFSWCAGKRCPFSGSDMISKNLCGRLFGDEQPLRGMKKTRGAPRLLRFFSFSGK